MAVVLEGSTKRYIGLSTDEKPRTESTDSNRLLPAGSSFLESDTGRIFRFDGQAWMIGQGEDKQTALLQAILFQLNGINQLLTEFMLSATSS